MSDELAHKKYQYAAYAIAGNLTALMKAGGAQNVEFRVEQDMVRGPELSPDQQALLAGIARESGLSIGMERAVMPNGGRGVNFPVLQVSQVTVGQFDALANIASGQQRIRSSDTPAPTPEPTPAPITPQANGQSPRAGSNKKESRTAPQPTSVETNIAAGAMIGSWVNEVMGGLGVNGRSSKDDFTRKDVGGFKVPDKGQRVTIYPKDDGKY